MTTAPAGSATPWRLARRAERMNPSVIRKILKPAEIDRGVALLAQALAERVP